jgi:hypothetical protein
MVIGMCHFSNWLQAQQHSGFFLRRIQPAEPGETGAGLTLPEAF